MYSSDRNHCSAKSCSITVESRETACPLTPERPPAVWLYSFSPIVRTYSCASLGVLANMYRYD